MFGRHFSLVLLYVLRVAPSHHYAGSLVFNSFKSFIGVKLTWYVLTVFRRPVMPFSHCLALGPVVGESHVERKEFTLVSFFMLSGFRVIMVSIVMAHVGRVGDIFKYSLSHIMLMVCFLVLLFSKFKPS